MTTRKSNNLQTLITVGVRIRVYWPGDNEWYAGVITEWNKDTGVSRIHYDDSEEENLLLDQETWEFESPTSKLQATPLLGMEKNVDTHMEPHLYPIDTQRGVTSQVRNADPSTLSLGLNPSASSKGGGGNPPSSEDPSHMSELNGKRRRRPSVRLGEIGGENLFTFSSLDQSGKKRSKTERVSSIAPSTSPNPTPRTKASSGNVSDAKADQVDSYADKGHLASVKSQDSSSDGEMDIRGSDELFHAGNGQKTSPLSKLLSEPRTLASKGKEKEAAAVDSNKNRVSRSLQPSLRGTSSDSMANPNEPRSETHVNSSEQKKGEHGPVSTNQTLSSLVDALPVLPRQAIQVQDDRLGKLLPLSDSKKDERENVGEQSQKSILDWLEEIGLSKYYPLFELHEIDENLLPLITMEDLKDMGIWAVGARRKMISSIPKLTSFRVPTPSKPPP